jgi:hypothetical protein
MRRASTASLSALAGLLIVLAGAVVMWVPPLLESRPVVTSTPSPGPWASRLDVPLRPGSQACVGKVPLDTATAQIQFIVSSPQPGTARLDMEARAPGYLARGGATVPTSRRITPARVRIQPPVRNSVGTVCVRNGGDSTVALLGTNEPTSIGLSQTSVDGHSLGQNHGAKLILLEAQDRSIVSRLGTIMHRAADFTGGLMPFWLAWPLVVLLVIGTPLAIFGGFRLAFRDAAS